MPAPPLIRRRGGAPLASYKQCSRPRPWSTATHGRSRRAKRTASRAERSQPRYHSSRRCIRSRLRVQSAPSGTSCRTCWRGNHRHDLFYGTRWMQPNRDARREGGRRGAACSVRARNVGSVRRTVHADHDERRRVRLCPHARLGAARAHSYSGRELAARCPTYRAMRQWGATCVSRARGPARTRTDFVSGGWSPGVPHTGPTASTSPVSKCTRR